MSHGLVLRSPRRIAAGALTAALAAAAVVLPATAVQAAPRNDPQWTIEPLVADADQRFGAAVAVVDDVAAIGAPNGDVWNGGERVAGAGWVQVTEFDGGSPSVSIAVQHPDPQPGDSFGSDVAWGGGILVVGAPGAESIVVIDRSTLTTLAVIPSPLDDSAEFGASVAASADGRRIAVGAPGFGGGRTGEGVIVLITRGGSGWGAAPAYRLLSLAEPRLGDRLGADVAVAADGSTVLAGVPGRDVDGVTGSGAGAVFAADDSTTGPTELSDGVPLASAGTSVALAAAGDVALIGAPGTGTVHVWRSVDGVWELSETLDSAGALGAFGSSVALSGDGEVALIGAPSSSTAGGTSVGAVSSWRLQADGSTEVAVITSRSALSGAATGSDVSLTADGRHGVIGSPGQLTDGKPAAGSAVSVTGATDSILDRLRLSAALR